ncbi:trace amine-associated receptor 9-like [Diadema setosum]|uniref:trace amine-associated receptor 9-like n=1 Tax=Diadema setosum TaxID=31175 RepID=UPI003B3A342A
MRIIATIVLIISGAIHSTVTAQRANTTALEHSPPHTMRVSVVNLRSHSDTEAIDGSQSIHTQALDNDLLSTLYNSIAQNEEGPAVPQTRWKFQSVTWTWVTIPQIGMSTLGIVGNLTVILVLIQRRHTCRSTDALIGALAVADFLTSVFMVPLPRPLRVPETWLGSVYCKVINSAVLMWFSVLSSIFILTLIPIERYIAIAHPLHFKRLVTRQRVIKIVVVTWMTAFMATFYLFFVAAAKGGTCSETFHSGLSQIVTGCMVFIVQFLIPAFIMLVAQALTALVLHRQSRRRLGEDSICSNSNPSAKYLVARKRVLKILFFVVVVFLISWAPTSTGYLLYNLRILPKSYLNSRLDSAVNVLAFCNSCANPIIYTVQNPAFRKAVGELFKSATGPSKRTALFSEKITGDRDSTIYNVDV